MSANNNALIRTLDYGRYEILSRKEAICIFGEYYVDDFGCYINPELLDKLLNEQAVAKNLQQVLERLYNNTLDERWNNYER